MIVYERGVKRREKERETRNAEAESVLHRREPLEVAPPEAAEAVLHALAAAATCSAEPVLVIENLVAGYGDVDVLHGVTVAVEAGQVVSLLGANGAGKATLCNTAARLVAVPSGRVLIAGDDVSSLEPHER